MFACVTGFEKKVRFNQSIYLQISGDVVWSNYLKTIISFYILGSEKKISLALSHLFRQWKQNKPCHASHTFLFIAKRKERERKPSNFVRASIIKIMYGRHRVIDHIPTSFDHRWIIAGLYLGTLCVCTRAYELKKPRLSRADLEHGAPPAGSITS